MEMTKEQAYKNLSLPEGADLETIRIRFAARYSLSDEAYGRSLAEGMKAVHEQHLYELETAYKVLTDSSVISDMGALLSLSKGYIAEGGDTLGDGQPSPEEALAFFALYPHDTPLQAEQRYTLYKRELEETIARTGLEASREPFRQEIARADSCLQVAVNYLMANEMFQSLMLLEEQAAGAASGDSAAEERQMPEDKTANTKWLVFGALALLALAAAGKLWWTDGGNARKQPATASDTVARPITPGASGMDTPVVILSPIAVPDVERQDSTMRQGSVYKQAVTKGADPISPKD
ncbi:hypothetical protein SAMN05421747_10521 [Parapedobacter composti]|uniref:Uncharacterized protein n=1 Tax=Parapedobacter composti TaxID=623281 RepID=A0A1I1GPX9_9SPHI|nr:hypothetical protein [Parapedobacter composti]SFC13561.1 hypothetical protein SAMN05421747_10521 [Parapedobacter composti]